MNVDRRTLLGLAGAGLAGGVVMTTARGDDSGRVTRPETRPAASDDRIAEYVEGNVSFGLSLFRSVVADSREPNVMLSPLSVSGALAMTWAGARGETEAQMQDALQFPHDQEYLHPAVGALQYDLHERASESAGRELPAFWRTAEFELAVANALWGQEGFPFRASYLDAVERNYGGGFRTVDFVNDPDGSREEINDWAADATNDRIDELFPPDSIDTLTRLVLTNAVYLLADWEHPFDPDDTEDRAFTDLDGSVADVPMMEQTAELPFVVDREAGYQVVELPYVGGAVSMVIVLPEAGTFESFTADLDATWLQERFAELDDAGSREVRVTMPRFEFDNELPLADHLTALGMPDAFDPDAANFDGIAPLDELDDNLFVHDVFHDTYVAVDEEGTEAAAASGVQMGFTSGPLSITADRPFLFLIRDRATDAVLFLGRVGDAEQAT